MNKGLKMLAVTRGREGQGQNEMRNNRNEMRNDMEMNRMGNEMRSYPARNEMEMRGYAPRTEMEMRGYNRDRRGRFTGEMEMPMNGYGMESEMENRFRDRQGREHYDSGRYAPKNEMEMNSNRWYPPYSNDGNMDGRGARSEMMDYSRPEVERRNPVGFAAHLDSPGKSDASYQRMDEMSPRAGSKMEHGGAMSHQMPKFDAQKAKEWVSKMQNEDGTRGPHWTMDQTTKVMEQRGIKEDPAKFYAVLNMMYSDYSEVAKKINANSMDFYAEMAKAFLKDKDAGAKDKLAAYYEYVVKG